VTLAEGVFLGRQSVITDATSTLKSNTDQLPCPRCGVIDAPTIGPGNGPHAFRATCRHCGQFLQWLSKFPQSEREARRQFARQQALAARPPTVAQFAYLTALGDQAAPPGNMLEASARIDSLLRKGEVV
jgi:hypothetical protein